VKIDEQCFVAEQADSRILQHVSSLCAVCYTPFAEGEPVYYDLQAYRYLCEQCAEELSEKMNDACEIEEEGEGLF